MNDWFDGLWSIQGVCVENWIFWLDFWDNIIILHIYVKNKINRKVRKARHSHEMIFS